MYRKMIEEARKAGKANEHTMWKSIDRVDELLHELKDKHPDLYWDYIYDTYEDMYGPHYNHDFAEYDVNKMWYTDHEGHKHTGPHWTKDEVVTVWQGHTFPEGTTPCDKWVAANAFYADLSKSLTDQQILDAAYLFWFADEDCDEDGKIWHYMHP